ncbi:M48 family metalloprotease [Nostoc sp. FACHB-87]|uniref:M48 family metallopeptidase n=1 Tax=Nostocaceae TaxID=1162 RepID=UPI001682C78A|nr:MULTISPECIES: M48 family metallopeptidase [Nostocaceae]MBD2457184.1 M48 family metalloprotease [Nostoc sp. FACHB-87]MBD2478326.1 M48 family metalloprotease [Anabaena sp. FACHB-83]
MVLTQEQFDNLVQKLESNAYQKPKHFKQRVVFLVFIGYGYILIILSFLLWIIVTVGLIKPTSQEYGSLFLGCTFIIAIVLSVNILRSLWVRIPKPKGKKLRRSDVPQLFKLVDELSDTLETPKFHNILLVNEFNAAVMQRPRLGIFGWFENYLILGLPLMQALTLEELRAVIAHEFGHLSGKHSRFAGWIYRIRYIWLQLLQQLYKQQQQPQSGVAIIDFLILIANGLGFIVFGYFFDWFVSIFTAYSFVLSRMNEYAADSYAADLVGEQYLAQALINMAVKNRYINRSFWQEIYQQADWTPQPPDAIYLLSQALHHKIPADSQQRWLKAALAEKTDTSDTHPCLSERLNALGYHVQSYENIAITTSAAEELFGKDFLENLLTQKNQEWQKANIIFWENRHTFLQDIQPKLWELEQKAEVHKLTFEEKWNLCNWTAEIRGGDAAIPLLQNLLNEQSYHAPANFLLGKILLSKQDSQGITYIENAVSCDMEMTISGYILISDFLDYEQGDTDRVKHYRNQIEQFYYRKLFSHTGLYR